jgi:hypothetical protein
MVSKKSILFSLIASFIVVSMGTPQAWAQVSLASGDIHTIDMVGDGLIQLRASDDLVNQTIKNSGRIEADGGEIILTAAEARNAVNRLIENTGTLQSNTVTIKDSVQPSVGGTIVTTSIKQSKRVLSRPETVTKTMIVQNAVHTTETAPIGDAQTQITGSITISTFDLDRTEQTRTAPRTDGTIMQSGEIIAKGLESLQRGGTIDLKADRIAFVSNARADVSGDAGGGTIRIGGEREGSGTMPWSSMLYIGEHAILNANATRNGNGGNIILWSEDTTRYYGHAEAKGGSLGGDGGFIETSSKDFLDMNGTVDLTAALGTTGIFLLDPTDIEISSGVDTNVSWSSPFTPNIDNSPSILNVNTLQTALGSASVIVQTRATGSQAGNITVNAPISWTSGNTLTLDAHNSIIINQAISAGTNGSIALVAWNTVDINANLSGTGQLTIRQNYSANQTMNIGDGTPAGGFNLTNAELDRIQNGFNQIEFGQASSTFALSIGAYTWNDNVRFISGSGLTVMGAQNFQNNNADFRTDNLTINANVSGTGQLIIRPADNNNTIMNIADGTPAGGLNLTTAELNRIQDGFSQLIFGNLGMMNAMNIGAYTWNDNVRFLSGSALMTVSGAQNFQNNNAEFETDNLAINANLLGTGNLFFNNVFSGTINIATAGSGLELTTAE